MNTLQDSLSKHQDKLRRALFDTNISLFGRAYDVIKISASEFDMYNNIVDERIEKVEQFKAIVNYPSEMPLERIRANTGNSADIRLTNESTSVFFFEVLPVEVYVEITYGLEKEDYIIHRLEDESGNPIPVVLKVTDTLGTFGRSLTWRKYLCAPYTDILPVAIKEIVESGRLP